MKSIVELDLDWLVRSTRQLPEPGTLMNLGLYAFDETGFTQETFGLCPNVTHNSVAVSKWHDDQPSRLIGPQDICALDQQLATMVIGRTLHQARDTQLCKIRHEARRV